DVTAALSYVVIVLIFITVIVAVLKVPAGTAVIHPNVSPKAALSQLASNKPLRLYGLIMLSSWVASGMVAGLYFFYVRNYLAIPEKFGHLGLAVAGIGFLSGSLWGWAGSKFS